LPVVAFDWLNFLMQYSEALLRTPDIARNLPPTIVMSGWVWEPGATAEQLAQAEARLGVRLPPSYRAFLQESNGAPWEVPPLWSTEDISWLSLHNQWLIDDWADPDLFLSDDEYLDYSRGQQPVVRTEDLHAALQIGDWGDDALYILNPHIVTDDGEWQAWYYSSHLPGFVRYPSFQEMMQATYDSFTRLN